MGVRGASAGPKIILSVRVTQKEAELLRAAAARDGIFASEFILKAALEKARPPEPPKAVVWDRR